MAAHATIDPKTASEIAKAEGSPTKGSAAAVAQSQMDKERSAEHVDSHVGSKLENGSPVSQEEVGIAQGHEAGSPNGAGPTPGSTASQAKSQSDKQANFEDALQHVADKAATDPSQVTSEDAAHLESRESRAMGGARPPPHSVSAEAKRLASANEKLEHANGENGVSDKVQSQADREANFQDAVERVKPKMEHEPEKITQEDASLLSSREARAHGTRDKGGIAAQAESLADKNKEAGTV